MGEKAASDPADSPLFNQCEAPPERESCIEPWLERKNLLTALVATLVREQE